MFRAGQKRAVKKYRPKINTRINKCEVMVRDLRRKHIRSINVCISHSPQFLAPEIDAASMWQGIKIGLL